MSKEESLKIQTCVLKVNIHCDGCQKKVKKILLKIEGVYETRIDPEEGKVMVSGVVDPATIIKKLNKAGKRAELWGAKAAVASQFQKLSLDGGGKGQPKDAGGKGQKGGAGGGGGGGGGSKDGKMAMPQLTPQQLQQFQLLQQLQMKGMKLPPHLMDAKMPFPAAAAAAPAKDPKAAKFSLPPEDVLEDDGGSEFEEFDDDDDDFDDVEGLDEADDMYGDPSMVMMKSMGMGGKKGGNEVPVQIKVNTNGKQNQGGAGGVGGKNGGVAQPNNAKGGVVPNGGNHPGHAKKGGAGAGGGGGVPAVGVGGGPMGGMLPQQAMMRPNMMGGGAGFPGMGQMGGPMSHPGHMGIMQHGQHGGVQGMPAGRVPASGFYQGAGSGAAAGGGMPSGPEMLQAAVAAGNPMTQQQYMALMQQQQQHSHQQMMMNGHGHAYGQGGAGAGAGAAGYPPPPPPMGYGYGYGRPPMAPYPMPYPMPPHPNAEPYNYFSDENPNSCSVM